MSRLKAFFLLSSFAATILIQPITEVYAADEINGYDETFYSGNDIMFFSPNASCSTTGEAAPILDIGSGTAEENKAAIVNYFVGKGLTLAAAAGIAANIQAESGFEPSIIQGGARAKAANTDETGVVTNINTIFKPVNEQGFGLSQWTYGGTTDPRQGPLYRKAVLSKTDIIDLYLQLDYIWTELNTGYKTSTLDRIKDSTDPREATKIYMVNYEAPKDQSESALNKRADIGTAIFNEFKGTIDDGSGSTIDTTTVSTSAGGGCSVINEAGAGIGTAEGFTFPLKTTKSAIKKGTGLVWCMSNLSNCHHDYNAADIFVETGTPILAAKPGKVVSKSFGPCGSYGCNVSIMGDDGILYYYTHMSKPSSVQKGQSIQAGQVIGAVGTNATAMGTPRHLHFDMLPGDKYPYRPGCSSVACRSYPFINVQPYLVPAYETLPEGEGTLDV